MKKSLLFVVLFLVAAPLVHAQGTRRNCLDITRAFGVDPSRCAPQPYYERGYRYGSYDYDPYGRRRSSLSRVLEYGGMTAADVATEHFSSKFRVREEDQYSQIRVREYGAIRAIDHQYDRPVAQDAYQAGYEKAEQRAKDREAEIKRVYAERERRQKEAEFEKRRAELDRREASLRREENVACPSNGPGPGRIRLQRQMREAVTVTWGKYSGPINSLNFKDNGASACVDVQPGDPVGVYLVAHADGIYECKAEFRETSGFSDTFLVTETDDEQADCVRQQ